MKLFGYKDFVFFCQKHCTSKSTGVPRQLTCYNINRNKEKFNRNLSYFMLTTTGVYSIIIMGNSGGVNGGNGGA